VNEKKRTGQNRTGKKSQNGYISPICGEAPTEAMYMKICVVGDVLDVITCAKFQKISRGYDFTGGLIFHFPIDFEWALQQCSDTALPVMIVHVFRQNRVPPRGRKWFTRTHRVTTTTVT